MSPDVPAGAPFPVPGSGAPGGAGRRPADELTSLDERLGLLFVLRLAILAAVLAGASLVPSVVLGQVSGILPLTCAYLVPVALAEWARSRGRRWWMALHRLVLPLDAIYLVIVCTPSGGPRSPLVLLLAVELIAVTLLASPRAGVRLALWDTFLFVAIPTLSLSGRIAVALGAGVVADPSPAETTIAILGFWAVALCTTGFSLVNERELRRSNAEMSALVDMAAALDGTTDEEVILSILLYSLVAAFPFQRGALWFRRDGRPTVLTLADAEQFPAAQAAPVAPPDPAMVEAWESRHPVLLRRLRPGQNPLLAQLLPNSRNVVILPVEIGGPDPAGIIVLEHGGASGVRMPRHTLLMVMQFAAHAGLALRNVHLLEREKRLAAIDGLTGLANRREFDNVLAREVARARRSDQPLGLVVFDVDHFKAINDTRGHLGGDEVLRALAQVMAAAVREMDLVARYGGEEFAIILPDCSEADAAHVVERVVELARREPSLEGVTLSGGVATLPLNASDGIALVAAADEALYRSKRAGRDRYTVSDRRPNAGCAVNVN